MCCTCTIGEQQRSDLISLLAIQYPDDMIPTVFNTPACHRICAVEFESNRVEKHTDRFSHDEAQILKANLDYKRLN